MRFAAAMLERQMRGGEMRCLRNGQQPPVHQKKRMLYVKRRLRGGRTMLERQMRSGEMRHLRNCQQPYVR